MRIKVKELNIKSDERGWLTEVLSSNDIDNTDFGLIHLSTANPGFIKGNHYHKRKTEWFCVIKGEGKLMLTDLKTKEKQEIYLGEEELKVVEIPPYILHSIENIGKEEMYLLAYVDESFDQKNPDTFTLKS